ncbi:MAG: LamG domain-containing protein [Sedimentisphaerales bacterium]|nr:LamG domain-containing protein [Sedimentisphaerales bacterium]
MFKKLIYVVSFVLVPSLILTSTAEASDPVGWWQLDEGAGLIAADRVGNHEGTLTGPLAWVDGVYGGALQFQGGNGSPFVDLGAWQTDGPDGLSLCLWAKWDGTNGSYQGLLSQREGTMYWWTELNPDASELRFKSNTSPQSNLLLTGEHLPEGEWMHVAFSHNAAENTGTIYLNGEERLSGDWDLPAGDFSNLRSGIGVVNTGDGLGTFNGALDDVMIFQVPLSQEEILAAMEGSGVGFPLAKSPDPSDGILHEDTWVNLSWRAGDFAVSHDVYIGDNFDDVDSGAESTFVGNQEGTFIVVGFPGFPYPDGLVPGTTYYWRIDEVNDADPNSPWKGNVWSFSIPPKTAYFPDPADDAESVSLDATLSWTEGFGAKLHTVYFGDNFDDVNNATGGQTQATVTYSPGTLKMAKTYYWRVDEFDIVETHKGDVWSFITEGAVESLDPVNGAVDVTQTPALTWAPGLGASYEIYFGTDAASLELKGSGDLGSESYEPGELEWNTTYYWRVDEANNANADSPWTGPLWSFTTANFLIIDDMESYNDLDEGDPASNRIYLAWADGFDNPAVNGSVVGNVNAPFAEQTIVHNGGQSMPMSYDNAVGKSEATLTLSSNNDWTVKGVDTLTIWFRGASGNTAETLYVALNGNARVENDAPDAATGTSWTEWNIPLQAFADQGVNLANVNSITLGLSSVTGGAGMMYFDDIRLYAPMP